MSFGHFFSVIYHVPYLKLNVHYLFAIYYFKSKKVMEEKRMGKWSFPKYLFIGWFILSQQTVTK
jgi:hypothetical protein